MSKPKKSMLNRVYLTFGFMATILSSCDREDIDSDKPLAPRVASYTIECSFEPATKIIRGRERLIWRNTTNRPAREMQFHLYMNAFSNPNSTFLLESGGTPKELPGHWGYCKIRKLHIANSTDLSKNISYIHPDDANEFDSTVVSLELPVELEPGDSIELVIEFDTKLPPLIARAGFTGSFHMVSQWFPKVGVYSDTGWNCHQYHWNSEFFADFGVYDVGIVIPDQFLVGATGVLIDEEQIDDDRKRLRFYAEDVHDFAWGADSTFVEIEEQSGDMRIRLLVQTDHAGEVAERIMRATKFSHRYFTTRYGRYPYPQVTILHSPVFDAVMEYPTLFLTGNFDGYTNPVAPLKPQPVDNLFMERLTIHELGHQWFYGMCANNEFEEAWLDEALTEYITAKAFEAEYGKIMQNDLDGNPLPVRNFRKKMYLENPANLPVLRRAWDYPTFAEYYVASYVKPKLLLYTLDNYWGEDVVEEIFQTFFKRWQFKHPTSRNFIDIIGEIAGQESLPIIEQYLQSSDYLDFRIAGVDKNRVKIERVGEQIFPVDIEFTFEGSRRITKQWQAKEPTITYDFSQESRLTSVHIDPLQVIEFELDTANNIWKPDN